MIYRKKVNYCQTIKSELENFDTWGLAKPDFRHLDLLNLQIWEQESQAKGSSYYQHNPQIHRGQAAQRGLRKMSMSYFSG
jgi:hypothetical protein